jgi:hypothetical protein
MVYMHKSKGNIPKLVAMTKYPKRKTVDRKPDEENQDNLECCCDIGDPEAPIDRSAITPTIEDFINIIEESNILLDRRLSLQLILMVDAFIGLTIIKGSDDNCSTKA